MPRLTRTPTDWFLDWLYSQATLLMGVITATFYIVGIPSYLMLYLMTVTLSLLVHHMSERCRDLDRIYNAAELALLAAGAPTAACLEVHDVRPPSHELRPSALNDADPQEGVRRLCLETIGREVCDILYAGEVHDAAVQREHHGEGGVHDEVLLDAHGTGP